MPSSRPSFETGRWREWRSNIIVAASWTVSSGSMVITLSVIHWRTRASAARARWATARRRSRSVMIPVSRTPSSITTTAPTPPSIIFSAASPIDAVGSTASTSRFMTSATVAMAESLTEVAREERLPVDLAGLDEPKAAGERKRACVLGMDEQGGDGVLGVAVQVLEQQLDRPRGVAPAARLREEVVADVHLARLEPVVIGIEVVVDPA